MRRVVVFGNSGSGKSTLAKKLEREGLAHLDLDTIAWDMNPDPARKPIEVSKKIIDQFMTEHNDWVIEGCYTDLLELAIAEATDIRFMNLSIEQCIENAKSRPWEPHKYKSKDKQDENLAMLIEWIKQYETRNDEFSLEAHLDLFEKFSGEKTKITENK